MERDTHPPAEQSGHNSAATFRATASSSRDILFGETEIKKESSHVKYGSKKKAVQVSIPPSARPRNLETIRIDLSDPSVGTSSRKRPLASSDDVSDIEILSPLTPLIPTTNYELNSKAKPEERWDIEGLGTLVWVRVDRAAQIFDAKDDDDNDGTTNKKQSVGMAEGGITVRPYGTLGKSHPTICIQNPSADNIRSLTDSLGRPRFGSTSARRKPTSVFGSSKKKRKSALSAVNPNWQAAVCEILRDKEDEDDGLPPIEFALSAASRFASASASQGANSSKRPTRITGKKEHDSDDNEMVDQNASEGYDSDWDPPEADEMLDIPGELVLARSRADRKIAHWPAKLLAYIPPLKPKGRSRRKEPKYRVLWLDDTEQEVPRSWFYACHEPEFGTCEMGKFSSDYLDNPEDDAEDLAQLSHSTTLSRSSSPVPLSSISCTFVDLPIRAQLAYVKPVLRAILNEKYAPVKDRHTSFMKGGKARVGLGASAGLRGTIPPRDVDKLQEHLYNWCFQDEIKALDFADNAVLLDGSTPHPLEHVENAALLSRSIPTGSAMSNTAHQFSKENIDPEDECASKIAISKEFTLELRSSPALTEDDFPASPSAPPPTSSTVSLLSVDDVTILNSQVVGAIIVEEASVKSERQKACLSYENLTKLEKINYCLNVLLPEAVLQLLLWRNGHRSTVELLSDSEEVELHQKAEKLAEETDWVFDVVRLREIKVRQLKKQASKVGITSGPDGLTRTSSRGRRIPTSKYQI
ncbi:hypothetical protein GGU10DRAFT_385855 [Lentinula aff. detonsa]|uniref:Uncharacterized protein n=1 Tax=Lentinula aff. detonsa TaxID=2804958 RepID=A0AA38NMR5_9AGAR|nr:hypothetical protein GGU10DRAFT_385855 [Lentinula aff. detonsa]